MTPTPVQLPPGLTRQAGLGPDWADWLDALPRRIHDLLDEWELSRDGAEVWHGFCSAVLPVHTSAGGRAVLKVSFDGDDEGAHEGLALQHWSGRRTVRLLRADPGRRALLLERLTRRDLTTVPELEACAVVAGLYAEVHTPAMPQLRHLTSYVGTWLDDLEAAGPDVPLPRRMVGQALSRGRDLVADPASTGVVVHGDLHYENVLADDDGTWVVIDPKPMSGDPHYEPAPMLWNRWDEVLAAPDPRTAVRRRFHTLVDDAALDEDRARDWVVVRSVINAHWTVQDAVRARQDLDAEQRAWVTMCLAVAKAVQD
ncbi:MAG TPA: aminoglycoside phosphotransferase family protein [Nocardioides sp.]|uniref:aminoglycoside phosphotransferase family protein n=1 Tax=Nocardioides sp. TaxID=35761 RepID=UPI002D7E90B5|nr:aminoglycoside phosphotransferase family protein [Nocardioides sp.]HET6654363.1 aminoglycoside phosphotransferase family protein [Nocardioides sp.]